MARCRAKDRTFSIRFLADKCIRLTMLFATAMAGLCFLLGEDLGYLLFGSLEAGVYIRVFSPLILILYLDAITDGMLKGLSQQLHSVRYNTLTSILDVGMLWVLLPRWGMGGFLAAFTVSQALNCFLSIGRLMKVTRYQPRFRATSSAALCCGLALLLAGLLPGSDSVMSTILRGGAFLLLDLALVLVTGALSREDLQWLRGLIRQKKARSGT